MKVFLVLSVIFVSVLGNELDLNRNSYPPRPSVSRDQSVANLLNNVFDRDSSNEGLPQYENANGRAEVLRAILRGQMQQPEPEQNHATRNNGPNDSSLGYWATYPDAAAFDAKIKARLSSSRTLADKPEIRRKINEITEEKFNRCKGLTEDRERACLGQSTGQIMQLVAAIENINRSAGLN